MTARRHQINRHPHEVERRERTAAHGIDVGQRIGRRDLPVGKRVVDDRREEIRRLHQRAVAVDAIHPGVVSGGRADQEIASYSESVAGAEPASEPAG